jgi:hypothetical protein
VFMFSENDQISLQTVQRYSEKHCNQSIMTTINTFSYENQTWKTTEFGLIELKQFYGCKLVFYKNYKQHVKIFLNQTQKLFNFEYEMSGNLTSHVIYIHSYFLLGSFHFFLELFEEEGALIVSPGREYTPYEKFILPLDDPTWIWCGVTFGVAYLTIFIINMTRHRGLQRFVYGSQIRSPGFNILIAFFGQSQNILPSRNFARYLLMIYILFCLIVRTGYQGVQFEMMYKVFRDKYSISWLFDVLG